MDATNEAMHEMFRMRVLEEELLPAWKQLDIAKERKRKLVKSLPKMSKFEGFWLEMVNSGRSEPS